MKKSKITEIHGRGTFADPHTMSVALNDGGTQIITFDNVIIATGSSPRLVPGTSLPQNVVTYEDKIPSRELPGSIIIAGTGAIGMEFGYVLKDYGVEVTIVELLPPISLDAGHQPPAEVSHPSLRNHRRGSVLREVSSPSKTIFGEDSEL